VFATAVLHSEMVLICQSNRTWTTEHDCWCHALDQ